MSWHTQPPSKKVSCFGNKFGLLNDRIVLYRDIRIMMIEISLAPSAQLALEVDLPWRSWGKNARGKEKKAPPRYETKSCRGYMLLTLD